LARPRVLWTLDQVRGATFVNAGLALRYLEQESERRWNPMVLHTLRAEAYLRDGQGDAALDEAMSAVSVPGDDEELLLAAVAVLADTSCWTIEPSAVPVCDDYQQLAMAYGDRDRAWCARALHATAVYHEKDCEQGRWELDQVARHCREQGAGAILAMVEEAQTTMASGCRPGGYALDRVAWAPVPGGQLWPAAASPSRHYLTSRLRRRAGRHTCRPATGTPG
jgi:hypothetical protein